MPQKSKETSDNGPQIIDPKSDAESLYAEPVTFDTVKSHLCPICRENNGCMQLLENPQDDCWCKNPNITFTASLLAKVPKHSKNLACICQTCALKHQ